MGSEISKEFTLTYNGKTTPAAGYSSACQAATNILKKHPDARVKIEVEFNKKIPIQPALFAEDLL